MAILVNGEFISDEKIKFEAERMQKYYYQYMQAKGGDDIGNEEELNKWATENIIEQTLLKQEAEASIDTPPAAMVQQQLEELRPKLGDMDEAEAKNEIATHMMIEKLIHEVTKDVVGPTEKEIAEFYEKNKPGFKMPEHVHASHIIKHTKKPEDNEKAEKEIKAIKAQLDSGSVFEDLAAQHSDCPESAGDLGSFPRGKMVPEFEEVVFAMNPGDVSHVFKTQFGYHIAKVHDKRPAGTASLTEVSEFIKQEITRSRSQKMLETFVDSLKAKAKIDRNATVE